MSFKFLFSFIALLITSSLTAQDYYYERFGPFDEAIPSPEAFLGYAIGDYHTRHDRIVAYFEALENASDRTLLTEYGQTHERRRLVILSVSDAKNITNVESIRNQHINSILPDKESSNSISSSLPVLVNLGYNVHGNEPSSSEAAMLTAYVLVASQHPDIEEYRQKSIVFIDPTINPDGRDRHTQWANSYRGVNVLVDDPSDDEHNEMWPRGRTNHYWFDLNRDWLLGVHPESTGKLAWYHEWYPNVVTDFHEMGSNSSYFFEPMKDNASKDPIMPKENYTTLNDLFAKYYQREMDQLGSLYFTKEVFDGTYPGYGSSYPDLQGGLGILFEQASSRGHVQQTSMGKITFPFTIRNQFVNSMATVEAAVDNRELLQTYQRDFFDSALKNARSDKAKGYVFGDKFDHSRLRAFVELLQKHKIEIHQLAKSVTIDNHEFATGKAFVVPTLQPQYRMVQTMFETYSEYRDSVFYDASAWSLANAFNMTYAPVSNLAMAGAKITQSENAETFPPTSKTEYAYLMKWDDYYAPAALYHLQSNGARVMAAQRPFSLSTDNGAEQFSYGTIIIPVSKQQISSDSLYTLCSEISKTWKIPIVSALTGMSSKGIDLGSGYIDPVEIPKALMLIGDGTSSYEAGFVWHLLDQRIKMPVSKIRTSRFGNIDFSKYNTLILISGSYSQLDSTDILKIKDWASRGNTVITIGRGTSWAINKKLVNEKLVKKPKAKKDTTGMKRFPYDGARERRGKDAVGGAIFEVDLDITHPIGYGYHHKKLPVYRNNSVWVQPSKNEFSNVAVYTEEPHIDGFITEEIMEDFLVKSTPIVVSRIGRGRAVLFSEDPNFRGTWYGTNKLFLNAIFFGDLIRIP